MATFAGWLLQKDIGFGSQAGVMGLLQGDQVTRFALPPPPGLITAALQPPTTADPAVVASQPSGAPSPTAATAIVLPAPEASPRPQAVQATDQSADASASAAPEQTADAAAPPSPQPEADARPEADSSMVPLPMTPAAAERQLHSGAASDVGQAARTDVSSMSADDASGSDKATAALQAGPIQSPAAEAIAQSPEDARATVHSNTANSSPATAADSEAAVDRHDVPQAASAPGKQPELAAAYSTPHSTRPTGEVSHGPDPLGGQSLAAASSPQNRNQPSAQSFGDVQGSPSPLVNDAVLEPESAKTESGSTQLSPGTPDVSHARDRPSEQPQEAAEQDDYGPLGPLG